MIDKIKDYTVGERGKKMVNIIKNSATHLSNLVNDILDMSRIENGKFELFKENFDIHEAVNDVINTLEYPAKAKNLNLNFNFSDSIQRMIFSD